jgi:hypothetical protein
MKLRLAFLLAVTLSLGFGDTLTLHSGKVVHGTYLGGSSRQIRMAVGDKIESFDVNDVSTLQFGASSTAKPAETSQSSTPATVGRTELPVTQAKPSGSLEIPAGTEIVVRMIDNVDSEVNRVGQTFRASLDEPIVVDGRTLVSRGADVTTKLVEDKQSGKLTGRTELTMALVSLMYNGQPVDVVSQEVTTASESRGKESAKVVGGAAALGAIIGAIAGGGKGAAVGATTGAGAGTAIQVLTKGERVKIPSETRLTFTLKQPAEL